VSGEWYQDVYKFIKSMNMNGIESPENMDFFNDHANYLAKLIHPRLPAYFHSRLPKEKGNLQLGQHWVWDSFSMKLLQLDTTMILSKHVPSLERLKNYLYWKIAVFLSAHRRSSRFGWKLLCGRCRSAIPDDAIWSCGSGYEQSLART
jgi:hypothetical protein